MYNRFFLSFNILIMIKCFDPQAIPYSKFYKLSGRIYRLRVKRFPDPAMKFYVCALKYVFL